MREVTQETARDVVDLIATERDKVTEGAADLDTDPDVGEDELHGKVMEVQVATMTTTKRVIASEVAGVQVIGDVAAGIGTIPSAGQRFARCP